MVLLTFHGTLYENLFYYVIFNSYHSEYLPVGYYKIGNLLIV